MLTSRVTATSNAVFQIENMFVWNVLPPCAATVGAIAFLTTVSVKMAAVLVVVAAIVMMAMFRFAAAGRPLHHDFASKAATVDGEMVDVIGNMALVRAFEGADREHSRFETTVAEEMTARRRSLLYLEKLRLTHALVVVVMTLALLVGNALAGKRERLGMLCWSARSAFRSSARRAISPSLWWTSRNIWRDWRRRSRRCSRHTS